MRLLGWLTLAMLLCGSALAKPVIVPDEPVMRLDDLGIYSVGYRYRGQKEQRYPVGWSGNMEDRTGVACLPAGEQKGKKAFLLHCPWKNGTGLAFQEFSFALPKVSHIVLRGATAMRSDIIAQSDGVIFRIYANGEKILETHRADADWKPFRLDLTRFAGKTLVLRFDTDAGPNDNPGFDFSLWGDRELALEGRKPLKRAHPLPLALPVSKMISGASRSVIPPSGFPSKNTIALKGDTAIFRYQGQDGTLEYRWQKPRSSDESLLGRIVLSAKMKGSAPVEVPLASTAGLTWTYEPRLMVNTWAVQKNRVVYTKKFKFSEKSYSLNVIGRLIEKSLVVDVECDGPVASMLDGGGWGPVLRRRTVPVPYYSGQVWYLPRENLFVNAFLDWTGSNASAHENTRAYYGALTDGSRNPLRERILYTAAWHLAEALPNIPNRPSPYLDQIKDRIVLDTWGGSYTDIAQHLKTLAQYGIRKCIAIIHVWQRSGYDNALPAHIPADASLGGDAGMKALISTGRRLGTLMALHENYVDYYPNYDHFDSKDISLNSEGKQELAWYNPGTKIQSFAVKPNAILPLAKTQSPEIHRRYGTNACYLDVHSAVPPWFHVDFRAGERGAGKFQRVRDVHRQLWEYERKTHSGPVFGEGAGHWYWSGALDGVEAQFGAGWPAGQGPGAPLAVDFDLLKIHPLQLNHGMGYYERWWSRPVWGPAPPMAVLDEYRMQEVAYGHAGFLGANTWTILPLAWLEHHLLPPVVARYAVSHPVEIAYRIGGKWVDGSEAARKGIWKQVRVRYKNGLTVVTNSDSRPLQVGSVTLPQFGWMAQGGGMKAYTALRSGVVADYAETAQSVFANARNATHWNTTGLRRIKPEAADFEQTGPRAFRAAYRWQVNESLSQDYHCFVHFGKAQAPGESILFQQDHSLPTPTSKWKAGQTVSDGSYIIRLPEDLPDGEYEWVIGLFTQGGGRLPLEGVDDGQGRIRLGILRVQEEGRRITFSPQGDTGQERSRLYRRHLNLSGKAVDFGTVRTNGSFFTGRKGNEWMLIAYPRDGKFLLELDKKRFGFPRVVRSPGGKTKTVTPQKKGNRWVLPLNGAREYRWGP